MTCTPQLAYICPVVPKKEQGGGGETLAKCLCWGNVVRSFQPIYQEKCAIDHTPLFNQIQFQTF